MNAENEFEKWWKENWKGPKNAITQRSIAFFAFQGALAIGRKSGLEEAAEIASTTLEAIGMGCPNVYGVNSSAAIRQRAQEAAE